MNENEKSPKGRPRRQHTAEEKVRLLMLKGVCLRAAALLGEAHEEVFGFHAFSDLGDDFGDGAGDG